MNSNPINAAHAGGKPRIKYEEKLPKIASITQDPIAKDGTTCLNLLMFARLIPKAPFVSRITIDIPLKLVFCVKKASCIS